MAKKMLGSVDLLGLNAFGQNPGMSPIYGALIGGAATAAGAFVASRTSQQDKKEWIGLGAGLAASAALYASKKTRHAALGSAVGTVLAAGTTMLLKAMDKSEAASTPGVGVAQIQYLNGPMGVPQIQYLNGPGLGLPSIAPVQQSTGTIPGVAGPGSGIAGPQLMAPGASAPVNLLGLRTPQSDQVKLLGGPTISGLSASYGATLLGGGR